MRRPPRNPGVDHRRFGRCQNDVAPFGNPPEPQAAACAVPVDSSRRAIAHGHIIPPAIDQRGAFVLTEAGGACPAARGGRGAVAGSSAAGAALPEPSHDTHGRSCAHKTRGKQAIHADRRSEYPNDRRAKPTPPPDGGLGLGTKTPNWPVPIRK